MGEKEGIKFNTLLHTLNPPPKFPIARWKLAAKTLQMHSTLPARFVCTQLSLLTFGTFYSMHRVMKLSSGKATWGNVTSF